MTDLTSTVSDVRGAASGRRISELDGWRGISILFVIFGHLLNKRYEAFFAPPTPNPSAVFAGWGVDIFFVISGFIITKLALDEQRIEGRFSPAAFYTRRIFRILPPFYLYLLVIGLLAAGGYIAQDWKGAAIAATFTCNIPAVLHRCGWFPGHSWTLAFEEQFYLTFPFIFCFAYRNVGKVFLGLLAVFIAFPFFRIAVHMPAAWLSSMAVSFSFITVGAVVAAYEQTFRLLVLGKYGAYISVAAAFTLLGLIILDGFFAFPLGSRPAYIQAALNVLLLPLGVAWTALSSVYRRGPLTRLLNHPALQFIGLISYSLYLWQEAFTSAPENYLSPTVLEFAPLMFVMATLSYFGLERPCIRFAKRLLAGRKLLPAGVTSAVLE